MGDSVMLMSMKVEIYSVRKNTLTLRPVPLSEIA